MVVRESLLDRVTLDWGPRGRKRSEPCGYLDKSNPGREKGKCKGPEVGCLMYSRNSKKEDGVNEV